MFKPFVLDRVRDDTANGSGNVKKAPAIKAAMLGLIISMAFLFVTELKQRALESERLAQAEIQADRLAEIIEEGGADIDATLRMFAVSLSRAVSVGQSYTEAFHELVERFDVYAAHPEAQALGIVRYAPTSELPRIERFFSADGFRTLRGYGQLKVVPPPQRENFAVIVALDPVPPTSPAIGLDVMATDRIDAVLGAIERRDSYMTGPVRLIDDELGVMYYTPIYLSPDHAMPYGFVAMLFRTELLFDELSAVLATAGFDAEIHDIGLADGEPVTPSEETWLGSTLLSDAEPLWRGEDVLQRDFEVTGRVWRMYLQQQRGGSMISRDDLLVLLGFLVAGLAALFFYRVLVGAQVLESEVARRTSELSEAVDTIRRQREDAIAAALRDELTSLLNRRGFVQAIEEARRDFGERLSIMSIDLDGFKEINDTLGHGVGDHLLVRTARALADIVGDKGLVARMGGDEFCVAFAGQDDQVAREVASAFLEWTRTPLAMAGTELRFGASIGIAHRRDAAIGLDDLLVSADLALYDAKRSGKNRYREFGETQRQNDLKFSRIADDLRAAIEQSQFTPVFQPQFDAASGAFAGLETLVRWQHPEHGLLEPSAFLVLAERQGIMKDIDLQVMQKAVDAITELEAAGLEPMRVSLNVSFARLRDPDLLTSVRDVPRTRAQLSFELAEAVFTEDIDERTIAGVEALRALGIGIEIDNFGTGAGSILALLRLSPDRIKIDGNLTAGVEQSPEQRKTVLSIVEMARALGIATTAERVESKAQADALASLGVSTLQGYAYAPPLTVDDLSARLAEWQRDPFTPVSRAAP